jgi:hexosaminidase
MKDSAWHAFSGPRTVRIGASSRDLRLSVRFPGEGSNESTVRPRVNVVPRPATLQQHDGTFKLDDQTRIVAADADARRIAELFNEYVLNQHGLRLTIATKPLAGHTSIVLTSTGNVGSSEEGYRLTVDPNVIRVIGKPVGLFYGIQTLIQLLPLGPAPVVDVPLVDITDQPRFGYRGVLLDVGRHFFSVPTIKKTLDLAAQYKINRFHWHLTDNEGWRIEIRKYPLLTTGSSEYYTQEQIRDIVAYAKARFITIVPEIEMPGHAGAATAAYPNLTCSEGDYANVLCPREETFTFVQDVLSEVLALFPGPYIHIGGDEVDKEGWRRSPEAQAIMKREGLKSEEELQAYFVRRVAQFLVREGRKPIGWDEILEGGLAPDAIVMSWRGESGGIEAARQQHAVIMSPTEYCYFDYNQGDPLREPESIGGFIPLAKAYSYDPVPKEMSPEHRRYVLGAQANLWTEYVATPEHLQYMLFPRLLAFAEAAWSPTEGKNYDDFLRRLDYQLGRLDRQDVRYRIPEPVGLVDVYTATADHARIDLTSLVEGSRVFYTLDGSIPNEHAARYESPFEIPLQPERPTHLNLIVVARDGRHSVPYSATYLRSAYREGTRVGSPQPGLTFALYDGEFSAARDIQHGKSAASGTTAAFDPEQFGRQFDFGATFEGYLKVPADGYYRFEMESDDGALLKIGDYVVIDNDGTHPPRVLTGHVPLKQGFHRFNLRYFQARGGSVLRVGWANGDDELQPLSGSALYH